MSATVAASVAVSVKAASLPVEYVGQGAFEVEGSSANYVVRAPYRERRPDHWSCECRWAQNGGRMCSHVQAAAAELARLDRLVELRG